MRTASAIVLVFSFHTLAGGDQDISTDTVRTQPAPVQGSTNSESTSPALSPIDDDLTPTEPGSFEWENPFPPEARIAIVANVITTVAQAENHGPGVIIRTNTIWQHDAEFQTRIHALFDEMAVNTYNDVEMRRLTDRLILLVRNTMNQQAQLEAQRMNAINRGMFRSLGHSPGSF